MSISNAMQTGVSGLQANSTRVGRISDNIANANTDGYRRTFAQMVTSTSSNANGFAPAGVQAVQGAEIVKEGSLRPTSGATDLAIGGPGFFVVSKNPNDPAESNYSLTRAGAFQPDENGNLRNAAGLYLAGFPYDSSGTLGTVNRTGFGDLETVNVGSFTLPGEATSAMSLSGNLPAQETGLATPGAPFVSSAQFFSPLGAADQMRLSWQPSATPNQWDLTISDAAGTSYGTVTVDFHDSGALAGAPLAYSNITNTAPAPANFAFNPATGVATLTINNGAVPQVIDLTIGAPGSHDGITQFAGDYSAPRYETDGFQTGTLVRAEIDERGDVFGIFDNGGRKLLYNIPLAEVTNPNGLLAQDGNAYTLSRDSGPMELGTASSGSTGKIVSGALESSNVEVAQELTDLIQTQRAYSSNAKIITTVDEMLDETMRLKR
ncbi:flagellar hook protein FlgE [Actibacterium sp. MT2.3-13A]|uniref:flagellar hook protein FlgE n=1 Tax=Actibacterium sp. MT2.3-13A TaxID=2828332 RepID=UPI001BA9BD35|nr:flagellar hook protein FlgE [Actibacterium sp. MT2.3-13A]